MNSIHKFFLVQIKKQFGEKRSTVGSHRNDDYLLKNTSYWIGCKLHWARFKILDFIAYQNKNYIFNWLNTLHVTFTIPRYRLECWHRPVQQPCIDWYYWSIHGYLFVCVLRNYNVTYNLILFLIISWTPFKQSLHTSNYYISISYFIVVGVLYWTVYNHSICHA